MDGIIIINKPKDFTSFDVVAVMRKLTHEKKTGHTGTLDPMATGVLPLLFGNGTKAQSLLPDSDKSYIADFQLGLTTDTLDITGTVTSKKEVNASKEQILYVFENFRGNIMQLPPMYSAVQKNGQRLYDLARKGMEVQRDKRQVCIHKLKLLEYDEETGKGKLDVTCSKGTYIRSLIDDIGNMLGCGGIMTDLCRRSACGFTLDDAITLEEAKELAKEDKLNTVLHSVEEVFTPYDVINVTQPQAARFSNGGSLDLQRTALRNRTDINGMIFRVKSPDNVFLGLGVVNEEKKQLEILKLFNIKRD